MNFQKSVKTCFQKYATFSGRASRSEFWFFYLFIIVGYITCVALMMAISLNFYWLFFIFVITIIIPAFAVTARRLHDQN